ncbi:proline racemase family protein [Paraburkholderia sp. SEWSISQ10-3 4]|uniref:proline racemase family protein n=1 Tax=Paraburkholderia TaxID=1822464 RepID=UPI00190C8C52|nr:MULTISPECIES: proline racemase family protein [Paraburkholderia]MBK3843148.1 proline racemase [Paraburkholderia aspalathi]MCX4140292.1 proline racemase family protein [Paraburkholderia aspalathi]MDN7172979.1 proline racemase family protein [Paraburkholderia sp. SEWSISQ10-3 4]MDQ6502618.1 proline racemase family protein [Paraburkholderia aspalathi]CAE6795941.1 4-hydroxyproline 2-epimerase [Paraburkholderia aspalathi]
MRWKKTLQIVGVHCEGEIGKIITGGVVDIPGKTMLDKMNHINEVDDSLRKLVIFEPRGCLQMSVNILLPPTRPEAHAGFIVMQADKAHPMSGSNAICVVTALLEMGMVPMQEPETTVVLDTPAGLVTARATCIDGRCTGVSLDMVPSFVDRLDVPIETKEFGTIKVDIAFGGVFYALIDVEQVGLDLVPENARRLADVGVALRSLIDERVRVEHPLFPQINNIAYVMFRRRLSDVEYQTCTTLPPGRIDRSPCGTGSSANLATLAARGLVDVGGSLISRSTIGSEFRVELLGRTEVGGRPAVLPRIRGRAWIYGIEQLGVDPDDPLAAGFTLSDTWGEGR